MTHSLRFLPDNVTLKVSPPFRRSKISPAVTTKRALAILASISVALPSAPISATLPSATLPPAVGGGTLSGSTLLYVNGSYYQQFSAGLAVGTKVWIDVGTSNSVVRATQRSLGYREVDYKKQFFNSLTFSGVTPDTDAFGNIILNYGSLSTSATLAGYLVKKNLPIIAGPDGNAYITDGHHTTAGFLSTNGAALIPGRSNYIMLGTTALNPSSQTVVNGTLWSDFAAANDAYLYGSSGNILTQPDDIGYSGLQPLIASGSINVMPVIPGTISMANDKYRSLTWGAADGIVKTATSLSGGKVPGYLKANSNPGAASGSEVNFVEFFWADFLRNRVMWNDNAAVTSANLINAPVSFFAATANAIALSRSEKYLDQYGRSLTDYTGSNYGATTQSWANASLTNGLAVAGDTYNMFLTDDVTIQGDILPSAVDGVTNNLSINTGTGMAIAGAIQNFTSIAINTGGSLTIDWKDSSVNAMSQNKLLTIAAGSANVVFSGDNDYSKLSNLVIGAGTLTINTGSSSSDPVIWGDISGAGSLVKSGSGATGSEKLTLSGANTFSGGVRLEEGMLVLGSRTELRGGVIYSSPIGTGSFTAKSGTTVSFDESVYLLNPISFTAGSSSSGVTVDLTGASGDVGYSVEFAGRVTSAGAIAVTGNSTSVLTLSGANAITGDILVNGALLRLSNASAVGGGTITLQNNGGIQAGTNVTLSAPVVLVDEGRLDAGESLLHLTGDISGDGALTISGHPFGTVRLSGLNTYSGGTTVNNARLEIGDNPGGDSSASYVGAGQPFGDNTLTLNSAVLGFAVSATVPNDIVLNGDNTLDVGAYTGVLSGGLSGSGALTIYGQKSGVLQIAGVNLFSGSIAVENTTLQVSSGAGSDIFGSSTDNLTLNGGALRVIPNYLLDPTSPTAAPAAFGTRGLYLAPAGGVLEARDVDIEWEGVISGPGSLRASSTTGNAIRLKGSNTYAGGTELSDGVTLLFSANENLGNASGAVSFIDGALVYTGSSDFTFGRALKVMGSAVLESGSQTVTLSGLVTGNGTLEFGRPAQNLITDGSSSVLRAAPSGTFVFSGTGASSFSGRTIVTAGTLVIGHSDSLKNSTLQTSLGDGKVLFAGTSQATLGGLSGDGGLSLPSGFSLSVGNNNSSSYYSGVISGTAAFSKVGAGNLTLGSANLFSGNTTIARGTLTLDNGASLSSGTIFLGAGGASLVVNTGSLDLSSTGANKLNLSLLAATDKASTNIIYRGLGTLTIDAAVLDKVTVLNLGSGIIRAGTQTIAGGTGASVTNTIGAGSNISLPSMDSKVALGNNATFTLAPTEGTVEIKGSYLSGGSSATLSIPSGVAATLKEAPSNFTGAFQADGTITIAPTAPNTRMALPKFAGGGMVEVSSGSVQLVESRDFTGTVSLAAGAVAELTGSMGSTGTIAMAAGGRMTINPSDLTTSMTVPSLSGGGTIALSSGRINLAGGNSAFSGMINIGKGVEATISGDLPSGTVTLSDSSMPLTVSSGTGAISFPGTVSGTGILALAGNGVITMGSGASVATTELKIGKTSSDKPTLDVSGLSGGSLTLLSTQTLSGGGTLLGSLVSNGVFSPGNSPGDFTVGSKTTGSTTTGGDLSIGSTGTVIIEYGVTTPGSLSIVSDHVTVAGTLTFATGAKVIVRPYGSFVTTGTSFTSVFAATNIVGTPSLAFDNGSFLLGATLVGDSTSLALNITKASYGSAITNQRLKGLGNYLSAASVLSPGTNLTYLLSVLDVSVDATALESSLKALSGPVYAESQRLSLRRTAAISETLQGHLTAFPEGDRDGWTAWSESYAWGLHRDSTAISDSWNGNTTGEVVGVQNTKKGLTFGAFGATGHTSASFTSSSLKGDSFHGGLYAHIEAGMPFLDVSWLAGSVDQTATRSIAVGSYNSSARSTFQSSEYAVHLRGGLTIPNVAGAYKVVPSLAILRNGYRQDGASESGADGANFTTDRSRGDSWQSRLGSEISRPFKAGRAPANLLASAYWIHDFNRGARTVNTRISGVSSAAGSFTTSGEPVGGNGLELGLGATVALTKRTSGRLSGNWQIRDGLNQPNLNLGLAVQF